MAREAQHLEYSYALNIETSTGESVTVPLAFLTREQLADFLQFDFKRLAQESGIKGARVEVQRAATADYVDVLEQVSACLQRANMKAA